MLHPKVEEFGGRVGKTTGDGTLIKFPSAVDALQHTVDVRTRNDGIPESARIEIWMVTNLGDVNVEDDDIFGHGYRLSAPDQVAPALERATREVTEEGRQDVADVVCA